MEIRYLLRLVAANVRFILLTSLIAGFGGLGATYVLSEDYDASTTILIRPQKQVEFVPSQRSMLDFPPSISQPPESISQTYAAVMTSAAVASRIVERLALDAPRQEPPRPWHQRAFRWAKSRVKTAVVYVWDFVRFGRVEQRHPTAEAVKRVMAGLNAAPVQDTYLFTLTATWDDPATAARIADTAAEEFIAYTQTARRAEGATSAAFLNASVDERRRELRTAQEALAAFRSAHAAESLEQQLSLKLTALSDLETAFEQADQQAREARAAIASLEGLLAGERQNLHTSTTMAANPVVAKLREGLAADEIALAGMSETHMPAHPEMKAITARIEEARRRIAAETDQIRLSDTSELNPFYRDMKETLLRKRAELDTLSARVRALDGSIAEYRSEVARLSRTRADLSRLELDLQVLEAEYRLLSQERTEATIAAAQEISEIRALAPAIPPLYPSGPIKVVYTVAGLAAGLFVSLFLVSLIDYTSPRIRTAEDVARVGGIPVLAQLPPAIDAFERDSAFASAEVR